MTTHHLKCWPKYFNAIIAGLKPFEIRLHDRDFKVSDTLVLEEWKPASMEYTGRECRRLISYVIPSGEFDGLNPHYCALGLAVQMESPALETVALCPHGMPLADDVCGPCSEGRPNAEPDLGFGIAILRSMVRAHMRDGLPQDAALAKVIEYGELRSEAIAALRASLNRSAE